MTLFGIEHIFLHLQIFSLLSNPSFTEITLILTNSPLLILNYNQNLENQGHQDKIAKLSHTFLYPVHHKSENSKKKFSL